MLCGCVREEKHGHPFAAVLEYPWSRKASRQEGKRWRLAFPLFLQKGVMIMTDYEILAIVLLMITLAFTVHNGTHK